MDSEGAGRQMRSNYQQVVRSQHRFGNFAGSSPFVSPSHNRLHAPYHRRLRASLLAIISEKGLPLSPVSMVMFLRSSRPWYASTAGTMHCAAKGRVLNETAATDEEDEFCVVKMTIRWASVGNVRVFSTSVERLRTTWDPSPIVFPLPLPYKRAEIAKWVRGFECRLRKGKCPA